MNWLSADVYEFAMNHLQQWACNTRAGNINRDNNNKIQLATIRGQYTTYVV